jgi:hypothetical protein
VRIVLELRRKLSWAGARTLGICQVLVSIPILPHTEKKQGSCLGKIHRAANSLASCYRSKPRDVFQGREEKRATLRKQTPGQQDSAGTVLWTDSLHSAAVAVAGVRLGKLSKSQSVFVKQG